MTIQDVAYIYIYACCPHWHIYMYTCACRLSNAFTLTPQEHFCISACFPDRVAHIIVGVHMCTSKSRHTHRQTHISTENFTRRAYNYQRIVNKHTEYVHTWHNKLFTWSIYSWQEVLSIVWVKCANELCVCVDYQLHSWSRRNNIRNDARLHLAHAYVPYLIIEGLSVDASVSMYCITGWREVG